jgi:hypothetical protein
MGPVLCMHLFAQQTVAFQVEVLRENHGWDKTHLSGGKGIEN